MELLHEFTGNYRCRNSGAEYLTIIATVSVQNACSKKFVRGLPALLNAAQIETKIHLVYLAHVEFLANQLAFINVETQVLSI